MLWNKIRRRDDHRFYLRLSIFYVLLDRFSQRDRKITKQTKIWWNRYRSRANETENKINTSKTHDEQQKKMNCIKKDDWLSLFDREINVLIRFTSRTTSPWSKRKNNFSSKEINEIPTSATDVFSFCPTIDLTVNLLTWRILRIAARAQ